MNYYMAEGDQRRGPFPIDQLMGQGLRAETLVWREGMADWRRAGEVAELRHLFGQAGGPPPFARPGGYPPPGGYAGAEPFDKSAVNSKRILVGVLAIVLGELGIHKFVLGLTGPGIILLLVTVIGSPLTCGVALGVTWVIGLIEGIIYLTRSDEDFYREYIVARKPWF